MHPTTIIKAYTTGAGRPDTGPLAEPVSLLHSKYITGGDPIVTAPLWFALLEKHDTDLHYTMYSSAEEVRCVKADTAGYRLRFPIAAFDLDFGNHKVRPTIADFADLVRLLFVIDHTPNVAYPTRGGARIIFLIDELSDPAEFEDRLRTLLDKLQNQTAHSPYQIDPACKDWTRLFRAPRVVRDGEAAYDVPVRLFHDDTLDLRRFQKKARPPRRQFDGTATYTGCDPWITSRMKHIKEGARNNTLYCLFCYVRDKYRSEDQEPWVAVLERKALAEGMEEREFWRTYQSAFGKRST